MVKEIKFCGFVITKGSIKPDKSRVEDILKIEQPVNVTLMQKFMVKAFDETKKSLANMAVLSIPNYTEIFHIFTDASEFGVGCMLAQYFKGVLKPIAFAKKELWGIVIALRKFRDIMLGSRCVVHTDHIAWLSKKNNFDLTSVISRWIDEIYEYDIEIKHIEGRKNVVADALYEKIVGHGGYKVMKYRISKWSKGNYDPMIRKVLLECKSCNEYRIKRTGR
eukprot:TRINITY_DN8373_c0_g3_i1.p1 TRINITY_DN8373_c0_g3~~TRINITY_DN8373_c0_g3_i1.p1  ORF type:complete len:221 (+),score=34.37 TRINITY_DN8373_c0_g3_i1:474-1136(+)